MWMKNDGLQRTAWWRWAVGVTAIIACAIGCKKKEAASESKPGVQASKPAPERAVSNSSLLAKVHWVGKTRILADTNSATLAGIWKMPESEKLEAQTLDKLAIAPWHPWTTNSGPITNYAAAVSNIAPALLLRPLLEDVVQEESYLEARKADTGRELALAIRLDEEHAARWETNLTALKANSLGAASGRVQVQRIGDWTLVGYGPGSNGVLAEMTARIQKEHAPFPAPASNFWLEADLDIALIAKALAPEAGLPDNLPRITARVNGDGKSVLTHANLDFPQPLSIEMEPWNIPTNMIHDPLIGFMAIRGIRPLLSSFKPWNDLELGTPPNQAYFWAQDRAPFQHFMAMPSNEASNQVRKLTEVAIRDVNPFIVSNNIRLGVFARMTNSTGVGWRGVPLFAPTLQSVYSDGRPYIFAGFFVNRMTNRPLPALLLPQVYASTNLLWYDWEASDQCMQGLASMTQLVRSLMHRPSLSESPGLAWLLAAQAKLGNAATAIKLENPKRLSLSRNSTIGFSAAELELLGDWLESPQFPQGLHTLLAPFVPLRAPAQAPFQLQTQPTNVSPPPPSGSNP